MSSNHPHAKSAKRGFSGKAVLWAVFLLILCLALPGTLAVLLFKVDGLSGLDLLNHDPMNLLPELFLAGIVAGLFLFLLVASIIALYVLVPRWLRTATLKGKP